MRYISTRGHGEAAGAAEAILRGIAPDGGLYVPERTAEPVDPLRLPTGDYGSLAAALFQPYLSDFSSAEISKAVETAYNPGSFDHPAVTPLHRLDDQTFVLELWHGPTLAFKDIALQLLPHLMQTAQRKLGEKAQVVILTATSGDTGKSALEGFRDVPGFKIIVYYPEQGVSEIQKLQMITQEGGNVGVAAVRGNFDHTQAGVKKLFGDLPLAALLEADGFRLSSANSINWGRLLPQIVYYFSAYRELVSLGSIGAGDQVDFVVPTGNFGNILAGFYAGKMGLPIRRLICASNRNKVLTDFINSGHYNSRRQFFRTMSPSMDILVSSNLERLLFETSGGDAERVRKWMEQLRERGEYRVDSKTLEDIRSRFDSGFAGEEATLEVIAATYREYGYLIDPHTAVGKAVLEQQTGRRDKRVPAIILSTASPYKFTGSVVRALWPDQRYRDRSETELLGILARETASEVPAALAELAAREKRHNLVIEPGEMLDHLLKTVAEL